LGDRRKAVEEAQATINVAKSTLSKLRQWYMPETIYDPKSLTNLFF
jgi:hypothetical protein